MQSLKNQQLWPIVKLGVASAAKEAAHAPGHGELITFRVAVSGCKIISQGVVALAFL